MISVIKWLRSLCFSIEFSLLASAALHLMLVIIVYVNLSIGSSSFISAVKENVVLVEMVDVKEYENLILKYNKDHEMQTAKKYSSIVEKTNEVEQVKVEDELRGVDKLHVNDVVKQEQELKEPDHIIMNVSKPALKPTVKVLKPAVKPNLNTEEELGSLLKSIDLVQASTKNTSEGSKDGFIGKGVLGQQYNRKKPISQSVMTAIKSQFMHCWLVPVSTFEAKGIRVLVHVVLSEDGAVENVRVLNSDSYKNNEYFKIMATSAIQAVHRCNPIVGLPKESYTLWKEMELNFDPVDML